VKPWTFPMLRAFMARLFASNQPVMAPAPEKLTFTIEQREDGDLHILRNGLLIGTTPGDVFKAEFREGRGYEYIDLHIENLCLPEFEEASLRALWRAWGHATT